MFSRKYTVFTLPILLIIGFLVFFYEFEIENRRPAQLQYELNWHPEELNFNDDDSWTIENDLGYQITIQKGYATLSGLQLVRCENTPSPLIPEAYAEHGDISDIAELPYFYVQDLTQLDKYQSELQDISTADYCSGYMILSRANEKAAIKGYQGDDIDPQKTTLYLSGSYQKKGDDQIVQFALNTDYSHSEFKAIFDIIGQLEDMKHATINVTANFHLAQLFNGIEMSEIEDPVVQNRLVRNLIESAEIKLKNTKL